MTYWQVTAKDPDRNLIYVVCPDHVKPNLGRVFREVRRASRAWRIIYKDFWGKDYEIIMLPVWNMHGWDRRSNPQVKLERWHGVAWDALKGNQ